MENKKSVWQILSAINVNEKTEKKFWAIIEGDVTYEDIKNISFAKQSLVVNVGAKVMLTANDANGEYVENHDGSWTLMGVTKVEL